MVFSYIISVAFGLSMDAFAVATVRGAFRKEGALISFLPMALMFGIFQLAMTVIGWTLGIQFRGVISKYDRWVAFVLLTTTAVHMFYESGNVASKKREAFGFLQLIILSIATSIDALAVGVTFSLLHTSIVVPSVVIGVVTFLNSYIGAILGRVFGVMLGKKAEILGALVLFIIALKIVLKDL